MAEEVIGVENALILHAREIRRLRSRLDFLTTGDGLRAIRIVGIIPPENLPSSAGGALVAYVSFGSEPTGGQTFTTAVMYAGDIVVKT